MTDMFDDLDQEQLEAVLDNSRILRILAGAGTGKTTTLTARLVRQLVSGIPAEQIMLLTFTRRAAQQMIRRCRDRMHRGENVVKSLPQAGTFHSLAHAHLQRRLALDSNPATTPVTVLDRSDTVDLMAAVRADSLTDQQLRRFPTGSKLAEIYSAAVNKQSPLSAAVEEQAPWAADRTSEIVAICQAFVARKRRLNVVDFDDLLLLWHADLQQAQPHSSLAHLFVDEYQDVNAIQAEIVRLLTNQGSALTVVGDDAQAIYGFRGAEPRHILDFTDAYPDASTRSLTRNYRSTPAIVAVSNAIADDAAQGFSVRLVATQETKAPKPTLLFSYDDEEQAAAVCDDVLLALDQGCALQDQAVLMRAANHSSELELQLVARAIPYVKYGGLKYLETAHVKDCLAAFRVATNPKDELAWFRLLLLLPGIGKSSAQRLVNELGGRPTTGIQSAIATLISESPPRSRTAAAELLNTLPSHPAERTSTHAARIVDGLRPLLESKYDNATERLVDLEVLIQTADDHSDLSALCAAFVLDEPSKTSGLAGKPKIDDDYLILSTIHSAKGLEWNRVHLLNVTDGFLPLDMSLGDPDGLEEERRLLYVAVTRARDSLCLHVPTRCHVDHGSTTRRHVWSTPSRFLSERVQDTLTTHHRTQPADGVQTATSPDFDLRSAVDQQLANIWR